jgi:hypothetical protein
MIYPRFDLKKKKKRKRKREKMNWLVAQALWQSSGVELYQRCTAICLLVKMQ